MKFCKCVALTAGMLAAGFCMAGSVYAKSYVAPKWMFSVGGILSPVELGSDWGEMNVVDVTRKIEHDSKLGEPGLGLDAQAMYFVHPNVAVGLETAQEWFPEEVSSGWWVRGKTSQQRYLASMRVYLNPQSKTMMYAALGGGIAHTKFSINFSPEEEFSYTGFAYYAGLGVERRFNERWSVGVELRYNGNKFHDKHLIFNGDQMEVSHQANYLSSTLRASYRI